MAACLPNRTQMTVYYRKESQIGSDVAHVLWLRVRPGRSLERDIVLMGLSDGTKPKALSWARLHASCPASEVWLVSVKTAGATLPGSRRAASPSTGKLLRLGTITQQPQLAVHCPSRRWVAHFTPLQCKAGTTSQEQSHAAFRFS